MLPETRSAAREDELTLHTRLLAGDVTAPAELAERYLDPVVVRLRRARPDVADEHVIWTAAIEAVFNYSRRPRQYQPERLGLEAFLLMAAKADLKNAQRGERRHARRAVSLDDDPSGAVELRVSAGNELVEEQVLERLGPDLPHGMSHAEALRLIGREFPDPIDRRLLDLILSHERRTAVFAAVLGHADRSKDEQEKLVKKAKDRIKQRLRRLRQRRT